MFILHHVAQIIGNLKNKNIMKLVHTPENVAHLFAHQLQNEARNSGNTLFFRDNKIYSYGSHFCIAKFVDDNTLLFTERSYSNTTAKHISIVRNATNHINKIYCNNPVSTNEQNLSYWVMECENLISKLQKAKKPEKYISNLNEIKSKVEKYCNFFKIAIPNDLENVLSITEKSEIKSYFETKQANMLKDKKNALNRLKIAHKLELKDWRKFKKQRLYSRLDNCDYLRYNKTNERFETSQGIEIPKEIFLRLWNKVLSNEKFDKVLDFTVKEIGKNHITVGCHKIMFNEVKKVLCKIQ